MVQYKGEVIDIFFILTVLWISLYRIVSIMPFEDQ
jgi:hypothetical protein